MPRQIFRQGQDIYELGEGSARYIGATEWGRDWSGQSDVSDLGQRSDLYSQYFPPPDTGTPEVPEVPPDTGTGGTSPIVSLLDRYGVGEDLGAPAIPTLDEGGIRTPTMEISQVL